MFDIATLAKAAHKYALDKGFYDDDPKPEPLIALMLIVEELGEACSALRNGNLCTSMDELDTNDFHIDDDTVSHTSFSTDDSTFIQFFKDNIKDTFEDEIADAIIRLLELSDHMGIDIEKHILAKMAYNHSRPYKHGKTC